jgi:uncharacterized protein (TIGR03790 family)
MTISTCFFDFRRRGWLASWRHVASVMACALACSLSAEVWAQPDPAARSGSAPSGTAAPSSSASAPAEAASPASAPVVRRWVSPFPRVIGRLTNKDLGLIINQDDPYSVQVGAYYAEARGIPASRILRVRLPVKPDISPQEFDAFSKTVDAFFGNRVQGLALAWKQPFAVNCNAITGALALGYDGQLCSQSCQKPGHKSRASSYFGSVSTHPYKDHHMRLSMLLAARDVESAKALIDRGVRSDGSLGRRGAPPVDVHFVTTSDSVRSVRQYLFPPAGPQPKVGIQVYLDQTEALRNVDKVLIYQTGRANVDGLDTVHFVPGALADHLTSFGGKLDDPYGQMSILSWIDAGATATYGTTSEPCAHLQKFPHPQLLLLFYVQGATALEAYWKSVAWPQQGLFVGEPLAAPYAR